MSKVDFSKLSKVKCARCGEFIKQNIVNRKEKVSICYKCDASIHGKVTARDARTGKQVGRAGGLYGSKDDREGDRP